MTKDEVKNQIKQKRDELLEHLSEKLNKIQIDKIKEHGEKDGKFILRELGFNMALWLLEKSIIAVLDEKYGEKVNSDQITMTVTTLMGRMTLAVRKLIDESYGKSELMDAVVKLLKKLEDDK